MAVPTQVLTTAPPLSAGRRAVLAALVEFPDATVITIADAAQVGRSSAAAALNMLEQHGLAVRRTSNIDKVNYRPPDLWSATPAAAPALAAIPPEPDPEPVTTDAVAESSQDPMAEDVPCQAAAEPVDDASPAPTDEPTGSSQEASRLGKGMLREAVREHLRAHPDATFTPTALSKALSRSSGAIANALDVLVADGEALMVIAKPRTFRLKLPS